MTGSNVGGRCDGKTPWRTEISSRKSDFIRVPENKNNDLNCLLPPSITMNSWQVRIITSPSYKQEVLNYLAKWKNCNLGAGFCVSVLLSFGLLLNLIFFAKPRETLDSLSQDHCSVAIPKQPGAQKKEVLSVWPSIWILNCVGAPPGLHVCETFLSYLKWEYLPWLLETLFHGLQSKTE